MSDPEVSPLKRALLAIEDMRARVAAAEGAAHEAIAICSMACRMPGGANDPEALWALLDGGIDAIGEVPPDRWDMDELYDPDPDVPGKIVSRSGGFVDNVDRFDPQFFGISPREAVTMDPQQRVLLEVSWEAFERAGIAPASLVGSNTGVYVGSGIYDYGHVTREGMETGALELDAYVGTGNSASVAAGRLSYALGLHGPSLQVDTACSSSLVSVHLACQALRAREADLAIAGGVSLIFTPGTHIYMSQLRALSPTGRCRTFDVSADGYVRSEGAAMIVLKRLSDAIADNDPVLAVIRGSAVNHDGRSSGLTVPNGIAQQAVIRAALADARVEARDIEFVEAHGTGTPLGDPIEVRALDAVYGPGRAEPLRIGSVKTNIGHLESASGIAGLLKLVLALQHDRIPPHLHLHEPTPHLDWDNLAIEVPTQGLDWPRRDQPRLAGVNSFGLSGTNTHVLISDPPTVAAEPAPQPAPTERPAHVITLSARSGAGLRELAQATATALAGADAPPLADTAFTLHTGRNAFGHRLALVASDNAQAAAALARFGDDPSSSDIVPRDLGTAGTSKLAFLFTGQGAQYPGMGHELYAAEATFREALDRCAAILDQHLERPLLSVMYPPSGESSPIDDTTYTQPALFALEYALATMWDAWGIRPEMMLGHSIGSYAAAHLAGVMTLEDALTLVAARGRLMGSLPAGGSMASVFATESVTAEAVAAIGGQLCVAAVNSPDNTVISGPQQAVAAAIELLTARGVETRPVTTSHAFHSELMEPILDEFRRVAAGITMRPPRRRRMVSDLTGRIAGDEVVTPDYWVEHLRRAVRFADGMGTVRDEGCNVFLELGPAPTLTTMGRRCLPEASLAWAASLRRNRPEVAHIASALGELWTSGVDVDWRAYDAEFPRRRVVLPTAPFQRQRYWVPPSEVRVGGSTLGTGHPLLGVPVVAAAGPAQYEVGINASRPPLLGDRVVNGRVELGAAVFAETALAAAAELWDGHEAFEVTDLAVDEPIVVKGAAMRYGAVVDRSGRHAAHVTIRVADIAGRSWDLAAAASIAPLDAATTVAPFTFEAPAAAAGTDAIDVDELIETWRRDGLALGPRVGCIDGLWSNAHRSTLHLTQPFGADRYRLYPPVLEIGALALVAGKQAKVLRRIERIRVLHRATPEWCVHEHAGGDDSLWFFDGDGRLVATASGFVFGELTPEAAPSRADWVFDLAWRAIGDEPIALGVRPQVAVGTWMVVGPSERTDGIAKALEARQIPVARFESVGPEDVDDVDAVLARTPTMSHVVFVPSVHSSDATVPALARADTLALLHLTQVVTEATWRRRLAVPPQIWLLTTEAMAVVDGDDPRPTEGALWGLVRTLGAELPQFYGGMIDLGADVGDGGPAVDEAAEADAIVELVTSSGDETWLARRGGQTYVARLRSAPPASARPGSVSTTGAHLVTGGFGALGLATARSLVARGARRLILAGRSPVPPRATWAGLAPDDPARARVEAIRDLESRGATVHVAALDVADRDALAQFLATYRAEGWPAIRGVFHAAGLLRDRSVSDMTDSDVDDVFGPKVGGTWNLHELLADEPLDHFVLFSSAAGLLGSPGQANYGAGNAFMDALAHSRRRHGQPALCVNWGAWAAGMADREDLAQQRSRQGQLAIPVDAGMSLLFDLLAGGTTQALVMPMTRAQLVAAAASPFLSELVDAAEATPAADVRRDHGAEILAAADDQRLAMMLAVLRTRIGHVLGLDADAVEPQNGLIELGLDSIMIVEMSTRLSVELGIGLNPREVFQEPSVHSLAATLLAALEQRPGADGASTAQTAVDTGDGALAGEGCVLALGAPGSGVPALRTAAIAAAPSGVVDGTVPSAETFARPVVLFSDELGADPDALDALVDGLPGVHVVHLVRHPFGVVSERAGELGQRGAEEEWHTVNGNLLDLAERLGPDRVRMVRIEDLVEGGAPIDALLAVLGLERETDSVAFVDGPRLDNWRTVELAEAPGRGTRQIAEELGYDTTWPVEVPVPTRGSGV